MSWGAALGQHVLGCVEISLSGFERWREKSLGLILKLNVGLESFEDGGGGRKEESGGGMGGLEKQRGCAILIFVWIIGMQNRG